MDQSMVKRGIGAVVLAIIAALLLGYLLKDKSRERQEVVDTKTPNAQEMIIPDLMGDVAKNDKDTETNNAANSNNIALVGESDANNAVIASADAIKHSNDFANTAKPQPETSASNNNPGFSIRPPARNETREIVEKNMNNESGEQQGSAAIAYSTDPVNEVIASSKQSETKKFKPSIVEEKPRKKAVKQAQKKKPQTINKQAQKTSKPVEKKAKPASPTTSAIVGDKPLGKYSIQLIATSSMSRAEKLANTMKSEGYKVFITRTQSNDKILFRVRVGGHANRDDAIKAQEGMKRRYQKNFFVQNSLVVSN